MSQQPLQQITPVRAKQVLSPEDRYRELTRELEANPHSCRWRDEAVRAAIEQTQARILSDIERQDSAAKRQIDEQEFRQGQQAAAELYAAAIKVTLIKWGAIAVMFLMFLLIVWPGVYRYEHQGSALVRINRLNGEAEQMWQGRWHRVKQER